MATIKLKYEYLSLIWIFFCLFLIFRFPNAVRNGVTQGLNVCISTIIPSLFPFMTFSSYITKSKSFHSLFKLFARPIKFLFRQPSHSVSVILLSMIGGYPIGIKMTDELYKNGQLTKKQAQHLSLFCMNSGPAFVISVVGANMLNNINAGIIMYASLCLSAIIIGVASSFFVDKKEKNPEIKNSNFADSSIAVSVAESTQSIIGICAWIILFSALINCINDLNLNESVYSVISTLAEVTNGCLLLYKKLPLPLLTGIIGFGGICVHCQIMTNIKNIGIKYSVFLLGRISHGILASIISYILFLLFPIETVVSSSLDQIGAFRFSVSIPAFVIFIFMCIIMIFDIDRKKKIW